MGAAIEKALADLDTRAGNARVKAATRKAECRAYYLARWAEGVIPGLLELKDNGWGNGLAVRVREELISEGLLPRKAGVRRPRTPKPVTPYTGPFVTVGPRPDAPKPARPREPRAKWLARLYAQVAAHAEANCMRTEDPASYGKPRPVRPAAWETPKDRISRRRILGKREREFGGIQCDLGISERG